MNMVQIILLVGIIDINLVNNKDMVYICIFDVNCLCEIILIFVKSSNGLWMVGQSGVFYILMIGNEVNFDSQGMVMVCDLLFNGIMLLSSSFVFVLNWGCIVSGQFVICMILQLIVVIKIVIIIILVNVGVVVVGIVINWVVVGGGGDLDFILNFVICMLGMGNLVNQCVQMIIVVMGLILFDVFDVLVFI